MPKATGQDLEKVTLNLVQGDKDTLAAFYPRLGWSVAARMICNAHCEQLRKLEGSIKREPIEITVPPLGGADDQPANSPERSGPEES